jgi:hypothetical protein
VKQAQQQQTKHEDKTKKHTRQIQKQNEHHTTHKQEHNKQRKATTNKEHQ